MATLRVYVFISLNGYYKGVDEDISWAVPGKEEEEKFAAENFNDKNIFVFGRRTYDLMKNYWPTREAIDASPLIAKGMNEAEKIVVSRSIKDPGWNNVSAISGNLEEEFRKLKNGNKDLIILGSSELCSQLADIGLIDEYQVLVHPVIIEKGTTFLSGIKKKLSLQLISTRTFSSGAALLTYSYLKAK